MFARKSIDRRKKTDVVADANNNYTSPMLFLLESNLAGCIILEDNFGGMDIKAPGGKVSQPARAEYPGGDVLM